MPTEGFTSTSHQGENARCYTTDFKIAKQMGTSQLFGNTRSHQKLFANGDARKRSLRNFTKLLQLAGRDFVYRWRWKKYHKRRDRRKITRMDLRKTRLKCSGFVKHIKVKAKALQEETRTVQKIRISKPLASVTTGYRSL